VAAAHHTIRAVRTTPDRGRRPRRAGFPLTDTLQISRNRQIRKDHPMLISLLKSAICTGFLALTLAVAPTASAVADEHGSGDLGLLRCDIEGKSNFVFKSTTKLDCLYSPSEGESRSYCLTSAFVGQIEVYL
jgi:hypothetical protein